MKLPAKHAKEREKGMEKGHLKDSVDEEPLRGATATWRSRESRVIARSDSDVAIPFDHW